VVCRKRFACTQPELIRKFFAELGRFQVVVEATSSYEWFLLLVEEFADRCVLAHPKKLRVIAESKNKSDKVDAQVLAEFLLLDMLPERRSKGSGDQRGQDSLIRGADEARFRILDPGGVLERGVGGRSSLSFSVRSDAGRRSRPTTDATDRADSLEKQSPKSVAAVPSVVGDSS
jgi:hypothetical protein